jgi:hypothetical protein
MSYHFRRRSFTIGSLTVELEHDGTVTFTDTESRTLPPVRIEKLPKARWAYTMIARALSKLPPHSAITVHEETEEEYRSRRRNGVIST